MPKDQYGEKVPDDLVVLNGNSIIEFEAAPEIEAVMGAPWYEIEGYAPIFVPEGVTDDTSGTAHEFCEAYNLDWKTVQFVYIADVLKRYSLEDGFYHA